jgi:hypothetical protein
VFDILDALVASPAGIPAIIGNKRCISTPPSTLEGPFNQKARLERERERDRERKREKCMFITI